MTGERFFNFVRGYATLRWSQSCISCSNGQLFSAPCTRSQAVIQGCWYFIVFSTSMAYRRDMNPIEETFSFVKTYLRAHDELLQAIHNPIIYYPSSIQQHNTISLQLMDQSFGLPTVDIQQLYLLHESLLI